MVPREEFQGGQIGEMAADRLLHIDLPAPGPLLGIGPRPVEIGSRESLFQPGEGDLEGGGAPVVVGAHQIETARKGREDRLGQAVQGGIGGGDRAIQGQGFRRAAQPVQQIGFHDDGGHIVGIDRQGAIEALQPAFQVAGGVARLEEVEPDRGGAGLGLGGALEPCDRPGAIARAERHHRQGV
jgi:hypothetical protein